MNSNYKITRAFGRLCGGGLLLSAAALMAVACDEDDFSEDYDINFPVARIDSVSNITPEAGTTITIFGEDLLTTNEFYIGSRKMEFTDPKVFDEAKAVVIIPRVVEAGEIVTTNIYGRKFSSGIYVSPTFLIATVSKWPDELVAGDRFTIEGENLDMLKNVKVAGQTVTSVDIKPEKATFSLKGVSFDSETAVITVTPKAGETLTQEVAVSGSVVVDKTYIPEQTILLNGFEYADVSEVPVAEGWNGDPYKAELVDGFFGKAFKVTSAAGNGWNGCYTKVCFGSLDLSNYHHPCLTFLVNTYGNRGYINPALTIGGSESDKHFTTAGGYTDDYAIKTDGWEWRSYDLADMGWGEDVVGVIENFDLWFRGGNVSDTEPFEIAIDQVMITDGLIQIVPIYDAESTTGVSFETGNWTIQTAADHAEYTGYHQGSKFANFKGESAGDWSKLVIAQFGNFDALNEDSYANTGVWINVLINTGSTGGYIQYLPGGGWTNYANDGYGDDYQFAPTNNAWEWRSIKVVPGAGDVAAWDAYGDEFSFGMQVLGGNYSGSMDFSFDYVTITAVPLDPNLKTTDVYTKK